MRGAWAVGVAFLFVVGLHCSGDEPHPEALQRDGGDTPTVDADSSPYGFDVRPRNPTCVAPKRPSAPSAAGVKLERIFPNIVTARPVALAKRPGVPRWYIVEQFGKILSFPDDQAASAPSLVLDLRAKVDIQAYESGLLGLAFHPRFEENGHVYVYYAHDGGAATEGVRVARFTSKDGGLTLDPASEKIILEVRRPIQNHLGGNLLFGPDGFLYIGLGDATNSATAQQIEGECNAAGCAVLGGKLLRIDVDSGDPYAIPAGNPFAHGGGRGEIFAWGFRNPWRWSFDRASGALWLADVGESRTEEIDVVRAGGNYGWPIHEGTFCTTGCLPDHVPPVIDIAHPESHSITGGYVYRGARLPGLHGAYVFGDFVLNKVWALLTDPLTGTRTIVRLNPEGPAIYNSTFAERDDGELIAVDWGGGTLYQLVPDGAPVEPSSFPTKLSATGCVDPADPTRPSLGVIPYAINVPFWSDGADKERFFAIPDGTQIGIGEHGDFDMPVGSVTMKTFRLGGAPVETRLFVRHEDGEWGGYSYAWDDDGKDATLLPDAGTKRIGDRQWTFPSRVECMRCHTRAAGRTLGLEASQFERSVDYPGRPGRNQLETLAHAGFFSSAVARGEALPSLTGPGDVPNQARAYLHVNCSSCHRPGGAAGEMDLRFRTPLASTRTCGIEPSRGTMGIVGARLVAPGDASRSLLVRRLDALDVWRMPPVASRVVDTAGIDLLSRWIGGQALCP